MAEQIHGHEVMKMMIEDGKAYTKAALRSAIAERFGADARFCTCSAENMTAEQLIAFLEGRGKFIVAGGKLRMEAGKMCNHE
jgi:probable metal-binding protein